MYETGEIFELKENTALVRINKKADCHKCKLCSQGAGRGDMVAEVKKTSGLKLGDKVKINIPESIIFNGALLMFGLPLAGLIAGMLIGIAIFKINEGIMPVLSGIIGMVLSLYIARSVTQKNKDKYRASVVKILS